MAASALVLSIGALPHSAPAAAQSDVFPITVGDALTVDQIQAASDYEDADASILRLYQAIFARYPDTLGAKYWLGIRRRGYSIREIAGFMAASDEWSNRYDDLDNNGFVAAVYENVLGRDYDQDGYDYWLDLVDTGQLNRPSMVFYVTDNEEFIRQFRFERLPQVSFQSCGSGSRYASKPPPNEQSTYRTTLEVGSTLPLEAGAVVLAYPESLVPLLTSSVFHHHVAVNLANGDCVWMSALDLAGPDGRVLGTASSHIAAWIYLTRALRGGPAEWQHATAVPTDTEDSPMIPFDDTTLVGELADFRSTYGSDYHVRFSQFAGEVFDFSGDPGCTFSHSSTCYLDVLGPNGDKVAVAIVSSAGNGITGLAHYASPTRLVTP